jgi:hypothetical protein
MPYVGALKETGNSSRTELSFYFTAIARTLELLLDNIIDLSFFQEAAWLFIVPQTYTSFAHNTACFA